MKLILAYAAALAFALSACTSSPPEPDTAAPEAAPSAPSELVASSAAAVERADRACRDCEDVMACQVALTTALQRTAEALQGKRSPAEASTLKDQMMRLASLSDGCSAKPAG